MIRMSSLEGDVAKLAKENSGDAVILVASEPETVGSVANTFGSARGNAYTDGQSTTMHATGSATSISANVQKQQSKYAVVKYVERAKVGVGEIQPASSDAGKPADDDKRSPAPTTPTMN